MEGQWYGYRAYDTFGHPEAEQVVVLHDGRTGAVRAVAVGEELGSRRTGALGGVAVDTLARASGGVRRPGAGRTRHRGPRGGHRPGGGTRPGRGGTGHHQPDSRAQRCRPAPRNARQRGRLQAAGPRGVRHRPARRRHRAGQRLGAQARSYAPPMLAALPPYAARLRDLARCWPARHPAGPTRTRSRSSARSVWPVPRSSCSTAWSGSSPRRSERHRRRPPSPVRAPPPGTLGWCLPPPRLPPMVAGSHC